MHHVKGMDWRRLQCGCAPYRWAWCGYAAYALLAFSGEVLAAECREPQAVLVDSGVYVASEPVAQVPSEETATGYATMISSKRLVSSSDRITAKLGVSFGFRYGLLCAGIGAENIPVTIKVTHPPLRNPRTGVVQTESAWSNSAWANYPEPNIHAGYRFDEAWEMVPGPWRIEVRYRDKLLIEKLYSVVVP